MLFRSALDSFHYFLVQTKVIFTYFKLFFVPTSLHFFYQLDTNYVFQSWSTYLAIFAHLSIFLLAYRWSKFIKYLGFSVFCAYMAFLPESSFFPIKYIAFEHRTYIPFIFICFTLLLIAQHLKAWKIKIAIILICISISIFMFLTIARINQANTYEKWISNEYQFVLPTRKNTLFFMGNFISRDSVASYAAGKEMAKNALAHDNTYLAYAIYIDLFSYKESTFDGKRKIIEKIANFLLANKSDIDSNKMRHDLLLFIMLELHTFFPDQLSYFKALNPILKSQISYLKNDHELSQHAVTAYIR